MRDVEQGIAAYRLNHVLGKDGHHQLEEAVIYRAGDRKGQVFARGVLAHTKNEHTDLDLGTIRWYLIVHNVTGAAYTLSGRALRNLTRYPEPRHSPHQNAELKQCGERTRASSKRLEARRA